MFWIIRGTDPRNEEDFALVVEAASPAAAEAWALKRNVPYIVIDEATESDIAEAARTRRLWKHTPDTRRTCFGKPIANRQLVCLMLSGVATIALLLQRVGNVSLFS